MGKRYLFVKLRAIGDTVLLSASMAALKHKEPDAQIDLLIHDHSIDLFLNHSLVEKVYTLPSNKGCRQVVQFFYLLLKMPRYDTLFNFHASGRSALFSRLISAKKRVIYDQGVHKKNFFTDREIPQKGEIKSVIEKDFDVLRADGLFSEGESFKTSLPFSRKKESPPVIILHNCASKRTKEWPEKYFTALIDRLKDNYSIKLPFHPSEKTRMKELFSRFKDVSTVHFIETPSIKDLCSVLSTGTLFFGMDSGPKHIAVAIGIPTLTLFSSESMGEYHPYQDKNHQTIRVDVPCRPNYPHKKGFEWCGLSSCDSMVCMKKIRPDIVFDQIVRMLK